MPVGSLAAKDFAALPMLITPLAEESFRLRSRIKADQPRDQDCHIEQPRHGFHRGKHARDFRNRSDIAVADRAQRESRLNLTPTVC